MKITAEFNSNEELISFIGVFGAKNSITGQGVTPVTESKKTSKVETIKKEDKPVKEEDKPVKEEIKETIQAKDAEIIPAKEETKTDVSKEDIKVTKEMVRERLGAVMKAGKQSEAKAIVAKHGAGKLPDLKEEDYAAVYEEAKELL